MTTDDIVVRLRVLNHHAKKLAENELLHDLHRDALTRCENLTWQAADEIERLRRIYSAAEKDHFEFVAKYHNATVEIERLSEELKAERFARLTKPPPFDHLNVLLWSESQRAFHIEKLGDAIARNRRLFCRSRPQDFVVVGAYSTTSECSGLRLYLQQARKAFEENPIIEETDEH